MSQNGKGDKRRPRSINYKTWEKNWNQIFKKEKRTKQNNGKKHD
jgi:uncharacterized membrane protein